MTQAGHVTTDVTPYGGHVTNDVASYRQSLSSCSLDPESFTFASVGFAGSVVTLHDLGVTLTIPGKLNFNLKVQDLNPGPDPIEVFSSSIDATLKSQPIRES